MGHVQEAAVMGGIGAEPGRISPTNLNDQIDRVLEHSPLVAEMASSFGDQERGSLVVTELVRGFNLDVYTGFNPRQKGMLSRISHGDNPLDREQNPDDITLVQESSVTTRALLEMGIDPRRENLPGVLDLYHKARGCALEAAGDGLQQAPVIERDVFVPRSAA